MNNLLKESMDNIFVTSANILDKLTYKLSSTATETVIPHNNDSLLKPLTEVLKNDFEIYNQVLDDFNLELQDTEYVLNHLKIRIRKEADFRQKMEEQARIRKQKEEEEKQAALSAREEEEKQRKEQEAAAAVAAQQQQQQQKMDQFGSNPDDLVLDLDLDNFNFGRPDQPGGDLLGFDGNAMLGQADQYQDNNKQSPSQGQVQPVQVPSTSASPTKRSNSAAHSVIDSNTGLDVLNDLDLDFLDSNGLGQSNDQTNENDLQFASGNDELSILSGLEGLDTGIDTASNPPTNTNPSFEDDGSLMPPDQMEHLFSQFDELVGGDEGAM
ncbi:DEKNAAC100711 [Brettanomyces naardenensis]|uniref:DEKNAAC100711 n=1 Tax=Brettanomyces naardenensis TaxID=13370 RepID=A0A448YFB9_BRENA|nr:DEKNAAC100711 [Brettanomyces naardenensis]